MRERRCQVRSVHPCRFRSRLICCFRRIHAQFDHISETLLGSSLRELGYALSFDRDLDMFAASLGLVKTSIEAVMKEDCEFLMAAIISFRTDAAVHPQDMVLDMDDIDPAETLYTPFKRVLDQCRSGKNPSRYVPRFVAVQTLTYP